MWITSRTPPRKLGLSEAVRRRMFDAHGSFARGVCKGIRVARRSCRRPRWQSLSYGRRTALGTDGSPLAHAQGAARPDRLHSRRDLVSRPRMGRPARGGIGCSSAWCAGAGVVSTCRRPRVSCALRDTRSGSSVFEKLGCRRRLNAFQRTGRQVSVRSEPQTGRLPAVSVDADAAVERSSGEARSSGVARTRRRRSRASEACLRSSFTYDAGALARSVMRS